MNSVKMNVGKLNFITGSFFRDDKYENQTIRSIMRDERYRNIASRSGMYNFHNKHNILELYQKYQKERFQLQNDLPKRKEK